MGPMKGKKMAFTDVFTIEPLAYILSLSRSFCLFAHCSQWPYALNKAGIPRRRQGHRHGDPRRHPRREDDRVGVGVGVVEFQLN